MNLEEYNDISKVINKIGEEINSVLNTRNKEKYFDGIILLYSFVENILKWLVLIKILWEKANKELSQKELKHLRSFYGRLNFYNALNIALSIDLIDFKLFERINTIREERNNVIHQFWIYTHRNNFLALRKKLEKLAKVANELVEVFNQLTKEISVEEVYKIFL